MRHIMALAGAALISLAASSAHATPYNFSEIITDSDNSRLTTVTGSFNGTVSSTNSNLITDLSNISVSVNGIAFTGNGSLYAGSMTPGYSWSSSGAVASFDGQQNDFFSAT